MFKNFRNKVITTLILLISFNGFSKNSTYQAPRATADEVEMVFWDMPLLKQAFISSTPEQVSGKLEVGELGVDGGKKADILKLANELAKNKYGKYDSLLISHQGKLLFESYFNRGRIDLPHFQFSATKGYTSLLIGRAMQMGYLKMDDLHKPLINFFKDLDTSKLADGVEMITLHHLLSMSSGLRYSDEQLTLFRENRDKYSGLYEIQAFLEYTQPVTKQSQTFKYQGVDPILVMHFINTVLPVTAKEFAEKEFFEKMGITDYKMQFDPKNMPVADSGVDLTSRDMLKIGEILANSGKWQNEQLFSESYLKSAFSKITKATESWHPENFSYGYLWYQTNVVLDNKNYGINLTWGAGGNRIIIVEDMDLVIVITGHDREDVIFEQITQQVLPAFL